MHVHFKKVNADTNLDNNIAIYLANGVVELEHVHM